MCALKAYCKISLLLLILLSCSIKNIDAQDTLSVAPAVKSVSKKDPMRATMLALAFPGMGQIYNYDPSNAEWYRERMLRQVDYFRKYRDLSYIGIAAWLLVTVLDANVDASLSDFDVSDNLRLALEPVQMPVYGQPLTGFTVNLKLSF
ncbi:MAG: hypothetical protein H6Q23_2340 [Bacteroidetes bacterium]|nr:hypothetical protein [Bacteroidota bacterium]